MRGAGSLDRRITIERATSVPNELNEPVETWATHATLWAAKTDVSDGERNAAGQVGSYLMSRFVVRHSPVTKEIKPTDRLVYEGTWNIHGIKETQDGRNRFLELTCTKDADL
jgi:SPP1 family predicted phage head-tail adaptor